MCKRAADRLRRLVVVAVALALVAGLVACASVDPVVKVALVAPFEGRYRPIGYDAIYSARLAVREINAAGGIDGHRVALVAIDDGGSTQGAIDAARTLIVDPAVVGVVGHWLPQSTAAAAPLYAAAGLRHLTLDEPLPVSGATGQAEGVSAEFHAAYTAVTPFDEQPGPYAYPTYLAFQDLFALMARTVQDHGTISRQALSDSFQ
jgi:hypothetical protein